jgi:ComF family protein
LRAAPPLLNPIQVEHIDQIICLGSYDVPVLAKLIGSLKYSGWSALGEVLPEFLEPLRSHLPSNGALIPLPLHPKRQRERGFNQAEVIAKALAKTSGLPMANLLRRTKSTKQQAKLTETERAVNVAGAFQIRQQITAVPEIGILVDDVITTGSTLGAAASVLRASGMKIIVVVCLAKG